MLFSHAAVKQRGFTLYVKMCSETRQLEFNTRLGEEELSASIPHTYSSGSPALTGGMQQAIGQVGAVSVARTQLAGGRRDAYVSTNTRLRLWSHGLHFALRGREREAQRVLTVSAGGQAQTPSVV